jgi:predicted dehydrogenase
MFDKQKDLDAVVISIPDHSHAPAAIMAMQLGLHVYCEKPMAHSIYEARLMAHAARKYKVATQMGNHGHAGGVLRKAVNAVRQGALGDVREFHAWTNRPTWPQGIDAPTTAETVPAHLNWDLWLGPAADRPYHSAYMPRKWRGWWDFGTGALGDMACHVADLGFWALDLGYPTSVEAESSEIKPHSAPSWSVIRYEFPARGEKPPVTMTWYDGGKRPDPALVGEKKLPDNGSILVGDKGTLYVPETYGAKTEWLPKEEFAAMDKVEMTIPYSPGHYAEWVEACKGGPPAWSNLADYGGLLTEAVLIGNLALRVGKKIEWDGPAMRSTNCPEAEAFVRTEPREGWGYGEKLELNVGESA